MRPQDIVILMKLISSKDRRLTNKQIADELGISASEISEALERCRFAKLIDESTTKVNTLALEEFLLHGLKYVYPVIPQTKIRGVATAVSAPLFKNEISQGEEKFVWPDSKGDIRGFGIMPLYRTVPGAVKADAILYDLLAIADVVRIGRARELDMAKLKLHEILTEYNAR